MKLSKQFVISLVAAAAMIPFSAFSGSTVSVSISDSITGTVGSISTSVGASSKSSTDVIKTVEGDYKVTDVAEVTDHPEKMRVALQAAGNDREGIYLYLSSKDFAEAQLSPGKVVTALKRPYGVAFAHVNTTKAFVVVLNDTWLKDLRPTIVSGETA